MTESDASGLGRLSRALTAAAPPAAFLTALGELPEVAAGQLWRARRGSRSQLVLIVAVDGATVGTVAVSVDEPSNADAVDLAPGASVLGAPLTVWPALSAQVPMRVLEQHIGELLLELTGPDVLAAVVAAGRPGRAAVSVADESVVFAARMRDTLDELAAAPLPGGTGQLPELLKASGKSVGELANLLGVPNATVLALRRGQRAIDADQARTLAPLVGQDPQSVLASNPTPPEDLVVWMSRPAQRRRVVRLARSKHVDEDAAFADATYSTLALAARSSGDRDTQSAWAELGERYLQSVLDEP